MRMQFPWCDAHTEFMLPPWPTSGTQHPMHAQTRRSDLNSGQISPRLLPSHSLKMRVILKTKENALTQKNHTKSSTKIGNCTKDGRERRSESATAGLVVPEGLVLLKAPCLRDSHIPGEGCRITAGAHRYPVSSGSRLFLEPRLSRRSIRTEIRLPAG